MVRHTHFLPAARALTLALVLAPCLGGACARMQRTSPTRVEATQPRVKDSVPERTAASMAAGTRGESELNEERWSTEAARAQAEARRQAQKKETERVEHVEESGDKGKQAEPVKDAPR